ncbi:hypothetical protein EBR21_00710, partial [bacterium]|nr:hypothetical protein [bacterium]
MYRANEKKESEELIVRRIARRLDRYLSEMERSLSRQPLTVEEKTEIVSIAAMPNLASSNRASSHANNPRDADQPKVSITDETDVLALDSQFGGLVVDVGIPEQSPSQTGKHDRSIPLSSTQKSRPS